MDAPKVKEEAIEEAMRHGNFEIAEALRHYRFGLLGDNNSIRINIVDEKGNVV